MPHLGPVLALGLLATSAQQSPDADRGQAALDRAWHSGRRAALREALLREAPDPRGFVILRGAGPKDDYRAFTQDNVFWYFTGVTSPDAVWVMVPETGEEWFLIPAVGPLLRRWDGDVADPAMAREITGIENCMTLGDDTGKSGALAALLERLAAERKTAYTDLQPAENWMMARDYAARAFLATQQDPYDGRPSREQQFAARLKERHGVEVVDAAPWVDALRVVKTPQEIVLLREACRISGLGHLRAMRTALPGAMEWQVAAEMHAEFFRNGAHSEAYAPIVGAGVNACVLHYKENRHSLDRGEIVMVDFGADFGRYDADVSRAWPVDARFSLRQREVVEAVLAAQVAAFSECRPGATLARVHEAANAVLRDRGFGPLVHSTSHWIGLGTHDVGPGKDALLVPGMCFTVEPGIYLDEERLGVRFEDVVVITPAGCEILTAGIPRSVQEIESLRRTAWSAPAAEACQLRLPSGARLDGFYAQLRPHAAIPLVASAAVTAAALDEAEWILDGMLGGADALRSALRDSGAYLVVMAHDEFVHQIPEYAHLQPPLYWSRRSRGFGAHPQNPAMSVGAENLLRMHGDPMGEESILVHEFAHTVQHMGLDRIAPDFSKRLQATYDAARAAGLWAGKYAISNPAEYWAEGVQSWFGTNRPPDHDHNEVDLRAELQAYDPALAALCAEVFGATAWTYSAPAARIPDWDSSLLPEFRWSAEIIADDANYAKRLAEEIAGR
jgi:Xaa-Pro aminopeptidase